MSRILVVDDNALTLLFLSSALTAQGHSCVTAPDGENAIACVEAGDRFDLLLIDARMPGCSGVETLQRIRRGASPSRDCPALATTAADLTAHDGLHDAGFSAVIGKPVGLDDLARIIAHHAAAGQSSRPPHGIAQEPLLDDAVALACAGNDQGIVAALRQLFAEELDALAAQCARLCADNDVAGLRDRLHRLAASAGFCGARALADAITRAEAALDDRGNATDLPELRCCLEVAASTRAALGAA